MTINQQTSEHTDGKFTLQSRERERQHATGTVVMACNLMKHLAFGVSNYYGLNADETCAQIENAVNQIGEELLPEVSEIADTHPKPDEGQLGSD